MRCIYNFKYVGFLLNQHKEKNEWGFKGAGG